MKGIIHLHRTWQHGCMIYHFASENSNIFLLFLGIAKWHPWEMTISFYFKCSTLKMVLCLSALYPKFSTDFHIINVFYIVRVLFPLLFRVWSRVSLATIAGTSSNTTLMKQGISNRTLKVFGKVHSTDHNHSWAHPVSSFLS